MDKKISELTASTEITGVALIPIVQDGINKSITAATLFGKVNVPVHINEAQADQDTKISGQSDENLVFVDASTDRVGFGVDSPEEKIDVAGGIRLDGVMRNESIVTQTSSGPIDLSALATVFPIGSPISVTIADGEEGQTKELVCAGVGPVVISGPNTAFASITLDAVGHTTTLKFFGTTWFIMGSNGATIV